MYFIQSMIIIVFMVGQANIIKHNLTPSSHWIRRCAELENLLLPVHICSYCIRTGMIFSGRKCLLHFFLGIPSFYLGNQMHSPPLIYVLSNLKAKVIVVFWIFSADLDVHRRYFSLLFFFRTGYIIIDF